jgi:hypothetical protein
MFMGDLEGFDPEDIADLEARAKRIEHDHDTYFELTLVVNAHGAKEFLRKYYEAKDGEVMSFLDMMMIVHAIAKSLEEALSQDEGS